MSHATEGMTRSFQVPRTYFTVRGNSQSETILRLIQNRLADPSFIGSFKDDRKPFPQECVVFESEADVAAFFGGDATCDSAVAVFDKNGNSKRSHTFTSCLIGNNGMPAWAAGCLWGIQVFAGSKSPSRHFQQSCAEQAVAHFNRNFLNNLLKTQYPWGARRAKKKTHRSRGNNRSRRLLGLSIGQIL